MPSKRAKKLKRITRQKVGVIISAVVIFSALTGINLLSIWQLLNPNVVVVQEPVWHNVTVTKWHNNTIVYPLSITMSFMTTANRTVTRYNKTTITVETSDH